MAGQKLIVMALVSLAAICYTNGYIILKPDDKEDTILPEEMDLEVDSVDTAPVVDSITLGMFDTVTQESSSTKVKMEHDTSSWIPYEVTVWADSVVQSLRSFPDDLFAILQDPVYALLTIIISLVSLFSLWFFSAYRRLIRHSERYLYTDDKVTKPVETGKKAAGQSDSK